MNSTNAARMATVMGALFDDVLLPIAQRMQERGVQAFPLEPDVSGLSYYVRRKRASMTRADFTGHRASMPRTCNSAWHNIGRHSGATNWPPVRRASAPPPTPRRR